MNKTIAKVFVLAAISCSFALSGCRLGEDTQRIQNDLLGFVDENTTALCSDGLDNDNDTLIDCLDPGCLNQTTTESPGNTVCPNNEGKLQENNEYTCSDGKDNDGNGYTDCVDNSCKKTRVCCASPSEETSLAACSDGVDNDCDGYTDCASYTCSRSSDPEVKALCQEEKCPDGVSDENSVEACSDGLDNDCDGYKDCDSFTCTREDRGASAEAIEWCNRDKTPEEESGETACSDGKDNNLNGLIDCDDANCKSLEYCKNLTEEIAVRPTNFATLDITSRATILEREKALCTDGIDNDHNGLIDCNEYQCMLRAREVLVGNEAIYMFNCPSESDETTCQDGVDNDLNGKPDCLDHKCKHFAFCKKTTQKRMIALAVNVDNIEEICADAIDNDHDGRTDCDDDKCLDTEFCQAREPEPPKRPDNFDRLTPEKRAEILKKEMKICTDGIDNDKNGKMDCEVEACVRRSYEILTGEEAQYMFDYKIVSLDGTTYEFGCK